MFLERFVACLGIALDIFYIKNHVINYFVERSVFRLIIKSDMIFPFIFAVDKDKMVNSNECY